MFDPDDLNDPGLNYTQPQTSSFGARLPEYAFRQLIAYNLKLFKKAADEPNSVLDETFRMLPAGDVQRIKGFFRDHPNIQTSVNYPRQDASLPLICVVNRGEQEDDKTAFLGDRMGIARTGEVSGERQRIREIRGVGEKRVVDIIIGTTDADLTMFLHFLIKRVFFTNKLQLIEFYDVHNLIISGRDLQLDPNVMPQMGFFKSLNLQFLTTFDYASAEVASDITSVGLLVDALKDNQPALTPVPGEQG